MKDMIVLTAAESLALMLTGAAVLAALLLLGRQLSHGLLLLPLLGATVPVMRLGLHAHRELSWRHRATQKQLGVLDHQDAMEAFGYSPSGGSGKALEPDRDADLAAFVCAVWLFRKPHGKHHWCKPGVLPSGRSYTHQEWRRYLIDPCLKAGILESRTMNGALYTQPRRINYQRAVALLRAAGYALPSPPPPLSLVK